MRKIFLIAPALALLTGCAAVSAAFNSVFSLAPSSQHGNFIQNASPATNAKLAEEAAAKLFAAYPPAVTRFDFQQGTPDIFGTTLVGILRSKGYAVLEFNARQPMESDQANHFRYVLDEIAGMNLYRITLIIGNESLSRAFVIKGSAIHPAGGWVRKE